MLLYRLLVVIVISGFLIYTSCRQNTSSGKNQNNGSNQNVEGSGSTGQVLEDSVSITENDFVFSFIEKMNYYDFANLYQPSKIKSHENKHLSGYIDNVVFYYIEKDTFIFKRSYSDNMLLYSSINTTKFPAHNNIKVGAESEEIMSTFKIDEINEVLVISDMEKTSYIYISFNNGVVSSIQYEDKYIDW